ncbi:OmpA family protein [Flavobacterium sp. LMO8]|uniref:OmpA family protein n=1 Tax=Flavobacterium sp. LMO8 TaxID=2654244 RepID=UPI001EF0B1A8|nr:OmpA family protein [Flavobacterium sp. LMO8]
MIGRADEKGSISYNDELSLKRVDEISKLIHNKVNYSKYFNKINLGEKFLSSHVDYENRRVDLYYIDHKFARYEDLIVNNINVETDLDKVKVDKSIEFKSHISAASLLDSINANPINTQFRLDLIHFEVDSEKLIPESKTELKKWIEVLKLNPKIKIIIQGHICCVPRDDYYLSTRRAKEVTKFFHDNGIEIDRMKYIGFGPTRPIYHIPERNGIEAKLNRRVEIIIVDK